MKKKIFLLLVGFILILGKPILLKAADQEWMGQFRSIVIDVNQKEHREQTYFEASKEIYQISEPTNHLDFPFNVPVKVKGILNGRVLSVTSFQIIIKPDVLQARAVPTGQPVVKKLLVLLINFENDRAEPAPLEYVQNDMMENAKNYFKEVSYEKFDLQVEVHGWYQLPIAVTDCSNQFWGDMEDEALKAAENNNLNPSQFNHVMFIFPFTSSCGWGGLGLKPGPYSWVNGLGLPGTGWNVAGTNGAVIHEFGHNIGLEHANRLSCGDAPMKSPIDTLCVNVEYGDGYDVMGSLEGHFNVIYKEQLNWISSTDVKTISETGVYRLDALEFSNSQTKALKFNSRVDGKPITFYLEYRRQHGFDTYVNSPAAYTGVDGVLVRAWSSEPLAGKSDRSVFLTKISVGQTYTEIGKGISIRPVTEGQNYIDVEIVFPPWPVITLADQTIPEEKDFPPLHLDDYVTDPDFKNGQITWSAVASGALNVDIDSQSIARINRPISSWIGSEKIIFTATNPNGKWAEKEISFSVTPTHNGPHLLRILPDEVLSLRNIGFPPIFLGSLVKDPQYGLQQLTVSVQGEDIRGDYDPDYNFINFVFQDTWTGRETLTIIISNPDGSSVQIRPTYRVRAPNGPTILPFTSQTLDSIHSTISIELDNFVKDPDNAMSEMKWDVKNAGLLTATVNEDHVLTVSASNNVPSGDIELKVHVQDPTGYGDSGIIKFTVVNSGGNSPQQASISSERTVFRPERGEVLPIAYHVSQAGSVEIKIYDNLNREVIAFGDAPDSVGDHAINWNGRNSAGVLLNPGVYRVLVKQNGNLSKRKVLSLR